jgi:elongation factor P hydroxylase
MDKNEVIATLRNAVRTHKQWVGNAHALIEGVPLDKEKVPLNATECEFGRWYYSDGQKLKKISGFKEIEISHNNLHKTYTEIFAILFGENREPSFFQKMFGLSRNVAAANRDEAMEKYHVLEKQSETIIKQIEQLEKVIAAMGETQLTMYLA